MKPFALVVVLLAAPTLAEEPTGAVGESERASPVPVEGVKVSPAQTEPPAKPVDVTTLAAEVKSEAAVAPATARAERAASPALDAQGTPSKLQPSALDTPVAQPKFPTLQQKDTKTEGLIPGILFGPKLSIIRLPTPALGVEVKAYQLFGASFDYGFIPDFTISNVTLGMKTWNVGAKVYPLRGAFFLGANLGGYTFTGKSTVSDLNGQPVAAKLDISTTFIAPEIGWRWVWNSGFFTGLDLGWQFPLSYKSTLDVPGGASPGNIKDVRDNADKYVKSGLPALGLFELGWFF